MGLRRRYTPEYQKEIDQLKSGEAAPEEEEKEEKVEVVEVVKKVEGPIEEPKTEEEKKLFPILDAMGIEHVDVGGRSDA